MKKVNEILKNNIFKEKIDLIDFKEKDREFCKHGMDHLLAVARIAVILNDNKLDNELIYAIALLHDIGKSVNSLDHEILGEKIAKDILKDTSFNIEEKGIILEGIRNHKKGQSDYSKLISKADTLSRNCFLCKKQDECKWEENRKNKELKL